MSWAYLSRAVLTALIAGAAGCASSPPSALTPDSGLLSYPERWSNPPEPSAARMASLMEGMGDPLLAEFLQEFLQNHRAIQAALARMQQAEARARLAGASLRPEASLAFERAYQDFDAGDLGIIHTDRYNLTLSAAWEIDLWGVNRQRQAAALAAWEEAGFLAEDVQLSTLAALVKGWFMAVEAFRQADLAGQIQQNHRQQEKAIRRRHLAGLADLDIWQAAQARAATAAAGYQQRQATLDRLKRELQVIAVTYPDGALTLSTDLPALPAPVPAGLPSDLLERRPDLRAAERQLAASRAEETSARRNRLPVFRITGSVGSASDDLSDLLDGGQVLQNFLAGLTAPLLAGGRLRAERDIARARQEEIAAEFTRVVMRAFGEVETALQREEFLRRQISAREEVARKNQQQARRAASLFQRGIGDLINILQAEAAALEATARLAETRHDLLQNRIDLLIALGGDWERGQSNFP